MKKIAIALALTTAFSASTASAGNFPVVVTPAGVAGPTLIIISQGTTPGPVTVSFTLRGFGLL